MLCTGSMFLVWQAKSNDYGSSTKFWNLELYANFLFACRLFVVIQKHLARGEVLVVDAGCLVAMTTSVELELKYAGPLKRAFFGVSESLQKEDE